MFRIFDQKFDFKYRGKLTLQIAFARYLKIIDLL